MRYTGRCLKSTDTTNHSVGLSQIAPIGTQLDKQTPLSLVHSDNKEEFERAKAQLLKAITVGDEKIETEQSIITEVV